jgi:hypothetical protein
LLRQFPFSEGRIERRINRSALEDSEQVDDQLRATAGHLANNVAGPNALSDQCMRYSVRKSFKIGVGIDLVFEQYRCVPRDRRLFPEQLSERPLSKPQHLVHTNFLGLPISSALHAVNAWCC